MPHTLQRDAQSQPHSRSRLYEASRARAVQLLVSLHVRFVSRGYPSCLPCTQEKERQEAADDEQPRADIMPNNLLPAHCLASASPAHMPNRPARCQISGPSAARAYMSCARSRTIGPSQYTSASYREGAAVAIQATSHAPRRRSAKKPGDDTLGRICVPVFGAHRWRRRFYGTGAWGRRIMFHR